jgi:hypothetical protein
MVNSKSKCASPLRTTVDGNFDRQSESAESGHDIRIPVKENDLSISMLGGDKIFSPVMVK